MSASVTSSKITSKGDKKKRKDQKASTSDPKTASAKNTYPFTDTTTGAGIDASEGRSKDAYSEHKPETVEDAATRIATKKAYFAANPNIDFHPTYGLKGSDEWKCPECDDAYFSHDIEECTTCDTPQPPKPTAEQIAAAGIRVREAINRSISATASATS